MESFTETAHAEEFILSEGNGHISRDKGVAGADLPAGRVVKVADDKYVSYDGSGTVVGITTHAALEDEPVGLLARLAEVNQKLISSTEHTDGEVDDGDDAITGLAALNIICR